MDGIELKGCALVEASRRIESRHVGLWLGMLLETAVPRVRNVASFVRNELAVTAV